jgi:hypothetical protein
MEERKRLEDVKIARDLERTHAREFEEVSGKVSAPGSSVIKGYGGYAKRFNEVAGKVGNVGASIIKRYGE